MRNQRELTHSEANLSRRIREERQRRGWSQATLAQKVAALGVPMVQSSVAKLERLGHARRPITVDEALAFAAVFEMSLDDLLIAPEAHADAAVAALYRELDEALDDVKKAEQWRDRLVERLLSMIGDDANAMRSLSDFLAERGLTHRKVDEAAGFTEEERVERFMRMTETDEGFDRSNADRSKGKGRKRA